MDHPIYLLLVLTLLTLLTSSSSSSSSSVIKLFGIIQKFFLGFLFVLETAWQKGYLALLCNLLSMTPIYLYSGSLHLKNMSDLSGNSITVFLSLGCGLPGSMNVGKRSAGLHSLEYFSTKTSGFTSLRLFSLSFKCLRSLTDVTYYDKSQ